MPFIQEKKFQQKDYIKNDEVISLKFNQEYQDLVKRCQMVLEQPKRGTAIKQMLLIGAKVLLDDKMTEILSIIYSNKRKYKRLGIIEFE